ncbi:unknown [Alistipes sp. CAG:29]|nr:unknown [Alistipes sp. CAG:29]
MHRARASAMTSAMLSTCAARRMLFSRRRLTMLRILTSRAVSEMKSRLVIYSLSAALIAVERRWLLNTRTVSSPISRSAQTDVLGVRTMPERRIRYLLRMKSDAPYSESGACVRPKAALSYFSSNRAKSSDFSARRALNSCMQTISGSYSPIRRTMSSTLLAPLSPKKLRTL